MHEGDKKSSGFGWEKSSGLLSRDEGKWVLGISIKNHWLECPCGHRHDEVGDLLERL